MPKFSDLQFKTAGCCADHEMASLQHPGGARTDVQESAGGYIVSTWCGNTLLIAAQTLADQAAVDARLAADALIEA